MPPQFVASGIFQATSGSVIPVVVPPARQAGDMLIAALVTATDGATITPASGWTAFPDSPVTDAPTGDSKLYAWWREADGSEPISYSFGMSPTVVCSGGTVVYTNAGAIDQQEMSASSVSSQTAVTSMITPSGTGTLVGCVFAADLSAADEWVVSEPLTKRIDFAEASSSARIAFADAAASDMALLWPGTLLFPDDVLYPDGDETDLRGAAQLTASVPMMSAIFSITEGVVTLTATGRRRMLMGVGA